MGAKPRGRGIKANGYIRCACGGVLRPATLTAFDFAPFAGLSFALVIPKIPGLRCDRCGDQTLEGVTIEVALASLAISATRLASLLPGPLVRYLRRFLRLTQAELAERMGVHRVTLAKWEGADELISPASDMVLRGFVLAKLFADPPLGLKAIARDAQEVLAAVRTTKPPAGLSLDPVIVQNFMRQAFEYAERRA